MKRRTGGIIPAFLLLCVCASCLCACAGRVHSEKAAFLRLRAAWLERDEADLRAAVRADCGGRTYDFVLRYEGGEKEGLLSVEEPVSIRGVEALVGEKEVSLRYDGALLDTGAVLGRLSALEAFPLLLKTWRSGPLTNCYRETWQGESCLTAEFDLTEAGSEENRLCRTRFRPEDGEPLFAELCSGGRTVLTCTFLKDG